MRRIELFAQIAIAADRALHQLREERYEERVLKEVRLRFVAVTVHVDDVAYGLEGIKGDTRRQGDRQEVDPLRRMESRQDAVDVIDREVRVFHDGEDQ